MNASALGPADVLAWAAHLGITVSPSPDGEMLRYSPQEAAPPEFVEALRIRKADILALLEAPEPTPQEVADSLNACLRLGQRLQRGEVKALRCGLSGIECRSCHGVPCLGSTPWEG